MITVGTTFGVDPADTESPHPDPIALLLEWLPADADPPPLSTLSTIGLDGHPDSRHLLISHRDADGLCFHTDTNSRKCAELAAHPFASIAVAWPTLARQLVARGSVEALTPDEALDAYRRRSRYLQLLAWQNTAEVALLPVAERHARWAEYDAAHPEEPLTPPDTWGGFRLRPTELVFWRGDPIGPSQRHRYTRTPDGWTLEVLPG